MNDRKATAKALQQLIDRYQSDYVSQTGEPHVVVIDQDWPSPCVPSDAEEGSDSQWHAVERDDADQFAELEQAMSVDLHPSGKAYWNALYGAGITIESEIGAVELLLPWNQDDYVRFLQNLTGHLLTQKRFKLEPSVFIGVAVDSELVVSVADDGSIVAELPGRKPSHTLAPDLMEFLQSAKPLIL
ncbi:SecY-interacting protein [Neiella sp. HB171785]|uniref:SecY-interacting protein n=1 Tax=Neiella litorisoli TaxID=2771431 RepID=A0A8J6QHG8_9GAMM|nr:SecY-interacting protein [Neiella litorisoli]MBD1389720.1 SecY-interacting protein [Neiella litorisoli]